MDSLEFLALVTGSLVLFAFFHPILACFLAVVCVVAGIVVIANQ